MGFFTDTSVCIGCKACEVACKEWNAVPEDGLTLTGMSFDNTIGLSASTWRHVAFIEQQAPGSAPGRDRDAGGAEDALRWLMSSDVCKHCSEAGCLDVCPTGALMRTEFGTVVVQDDVCNGCGYCVPACPFGVIGRREDDGGAHKCTLCYDRLGVGMEPACAKACPTDSIQFGPLDELRERAQARVSDLQEAGQDRRPALPGGPRRRYRRRGRVLPAARRARGLRPAAGPGRVHAIPAAHVETRRPGRGRRRCHGPDRFSWIPNGRAMSASQPGTNPARGTNSGPAGSNGGRHARNGRGRGSGRGGEQFMVPRAEFRSYYGRPVIKEPVWKEPDVPAYLFFGGLAGASSVLARGGPAHRAPRPGPGREGGRPGRDQRVDRGADQ